MDSGLKLSGRRKDGSEFPVDISLAPLETDNGTRVIAAIRDVSVTLAEREGLEALREVAVSSSGVLDPSTLGRLVVERARNLLRGDDATLLWWDAAQNGLRALADTFERPLARLVGVGEGTAGIAFQTRRQVVIDDYPGWEHAVPDALQRGMQSVVAVPLLVRDKPVGALTVSFTTRRSFKDEDLRMLTLLAAQVAPALEAARLHDAVLQISEELREASETKSRFLASMSHELRTPLNSIIGFAELLIDSPEGTFGVEKRTQFLTHIHQSGQHLLALINDILDLAKVEAGEMELRRSSFVLGATIAAAVGTVSPLADKKRLSLQVEPGPGVVVFADEGKVRQMLLNLLSNAIKFTPEGGSVNVSVEIEGEIRVCVADSGVGIAAADMGRLFVEFQQLDQGLGRRQQGTGLGLALTKRLAQLHGGRVWVESELGSGSRFFFALPLSVATPEIVEPAGEAGPAADGPLVMVVENQSSAAALLSFSLRQAGYRVEIVRDGRNVLRKAIELRPRAITLDILLPDPDGWDVLRELKEAPETREIPVVVISVLDDRSLGLALGADDYLVKPVPREALLGFLARHSPAEVDDAPLKVLAIDDDPAALRLLKEGLEPRFAVLTAGDGPRGIEIAKSERPDVIILDLVMPGMSGFEVAGTLRANESTRAIPILLLTAKDLSKVEKVRLNGHVSKVMHKGESATSELLKWLKDQPQLRRPK